MPGTGGAFKREPEDFVVDEVPLAPFTGRGEHLLLHIEKRRLTTHEVARRLAEHFDRPLREIGFAGIKDSRAITRQWFSLRLSGKPELGRGLQSESLSVLTTDRHERRLRPGDLAGNRFEIRLRNTRPGSLEVAEQTLAELTERGVPNWFGPQRFGTKGDSDEIGRALLRSDWREAASWFLGRPSPLERDRRIHEARRLFDAGQLDEALRRWPDHMRNERRVLQAYRRRQDGRHALGLLGKSLRLLFLSAFQSRVFNECLRRRIDRLGTLERGDVLYVHRTGATFPVHDPGQRQPEVDALEASPAGPLFGPKLRRTQEGVADVEQSVFTAAEVDPERARSPFRDAFLRGERRPYRIPMAGARVWSESRSNLVMSFELPSGCYATSVVAEITKDPDLLAAPARWAGN